MFNRTNRRQKFNKLLLLTEKKFDRGSSRKWKNKDFEDLCFSIHLETKILISSGTLKRVFGKTETNKDYFPQEATITALELYTGFELFPTIPVRSSVFKSQKIKIAIPVILAIIITVLLLILIPKERVIPTADLKLLKIDGASPATVYFNYQYSETDDSIFLDYGDNSDPLYLRDAQKEMSHFYRYPGKFISNIQTRSAIISDSIGFFVPTKGWQVLASYFNQKYDERFFPIPLRENCDKGAFQITRRYISSLGMDTTRIVVVQLDNYKETTINGNSFSLETNLTNSSFWPAIRCFSAYVIVEGEYGRIHFKFVNSGCSQFSEFFIGEKNRVNLPKDLTGFSIDMLVWNNIKIENKNKHVLVKVNDVLIFEDSYNQSIGNIIGATIKFHGIGSVDYFHLADSKGQSIFTEEFD